MGFLVWVSQNWFNLFGAGGIAGVWFAAYSIHEEAKARRNANLLTITANRNELWREFLMNDKLARVRDATADTVKKPVTDVEHVFVTSVILHTSSVYYTMNDQMVVRLEGLRKDVAQFLSLPIPNAVWERIKIFQNKEFVVFMESCRNAR